MIHALGRHLGPQGSARNPGLLEQLGPPLTPLAVRQGFERTQVGKNRSLGTPGAKQVFGPFGIDAVLTAPGRIDHG